MAVNDGHIIIRPDQDEAFRRAMEYQERKVVADLAGAAPYFDPIEGLYDVDTNPAVAAQPKRLTKYQLRDMAESFAIHGLRTAVSFLRDEVVVTFMNWKGKRRECRFGVNALPTAGAAMAQLHSLGEAARA